MILSATSQFGIEDGASLRRLSGVLLGRECCYGVDILQPTGTNARPCETGTIKPLAQTAGYKNLMEGRKRDERVAVWPGR